MSLVLCDFELEGTLGASLCQIRHSRQTLKKGFSRTPWWAREWCPKDDQCRIWLLCGTVHFLVHKRVIHPFSRDLFCPTLQVNWLLDYWRKSDNCKSTNSTVSEVIREFLPTSIIYCSFISNWTFLKFNYPIHPLQLRSSFPAGCVSVDHYYRFDCNFANTIKLPIIRIFMTKT
jgi:hypothetical protein